MAGLYDKQAASYASARPTYPSEWFQMLAALTPDHSLAWDVGTGNGQAAVSVAEHYAQVIATDISEGQLNHAAAHPRVKYLHTPSSISDDELVALIGGENSVDLVTAATAVHWFDLPKFYSIVKRVLKKPGGVIAVWTYGKAQGNDEFDSIRKGLSERTAPFFPENTMYAFEGYRTLPFPFESVGIGSEGKPLELDMWKDMSFEGFVRLLRSTSAAIKAKEQGIDLIGEEMVKELETAWGGSELVKTVNFKSYMLAGKV